MGSHWPMMYRQSSQVFTLRRGTPHVRPLLPHRGMLGQEGLPVHAHGSQMQELQGSSPCPGQCVPGEEGGPSVGQGVEGTLSRAGSRRHAGSSDSRCATAWPEATVGRGRNGERIANDGMAGGTAGGHGRGRDDKEGDGVAGRPQLPAGDKEAMLRSGLLQTAKSQEQDGSHTRHS